jgi:putative endopeptidase
MSPILAALVALAAVSPQAAPPGMDVAGMDRSVTPGADFFAYANGTWLKTTEIPPDRASYSTGAIVSAVTEKRTVELIQRAPKGSPVGDFYASFMDEAAIEKAGLAPLAPALDRIRAITDKHALAGFLGSTLRADVDALNATNLTTDNVLGLWVAQDLDNPKQYVPFLLQGGLDMPDRDYYLDASPKMAELRKKYLAHVEAILKLAKAGDAKVKAAGVFDLERKIAEAHATREDSGEVRKGNNHWARGEFAIKAPGLDWEAYFGAAGLREAQTFVVWQPRAVTGLAALVSSEPLDTWKDYLTFHAVEHHASVLQKAVVRESFTFHGTTVQGVAVLRDRW